MYLLRRITGASNRAEAIRLAIRFTLRQQPEVRDLLQAADREALETAKRMERALRRHERATLRVVEHARGITQAMEARFNVTRARSLTSEPSSSSGAVTS